MRSAWLGIAGSGIARLATGGSVFLALLLVARRFGPAGLGVVAAAVAWAALFATVTSLSLGQVAHRGLSTAPATRASQETVGTMLSIAMLVPLCALAVLAWLRMSGRTNIWDALSAVASLAAAALVPLLIVDEYARNLLAGLGRLREYAVAQIAGSLGRLALVWLACAVPAGTVDGVIIALLAAQFLTSAFELWPLWQHCGRRLRVSWRRSRQLIGDALRLHPNTVASFALVQANLLILDRFTTPQDVGQYQLALQLVALFLLLPQAAAMWFFGQVARLGPDAAWPGQRRVLVQVMTVGTLGGLAAFAVAPDVLDVLAGPGFESAARAFRWLLLAVLGMSLAEMMAPQWLSRGLFAQASLLTVVAATLNVAANVVLVQRHGMMGVVYGTVGVYLGFVVVAQCGFASWCNGRHHV